MMGALAVTVVVFIGLLAAALVYREQAAAFLVSGSGVLFVALALVALSTMWLPGVYRSAANGALVALGVRDQIRTIDERFVLNDVVEGSGALLDAARDLSDGTTSLLDLAAALLGRTEEAPDAAPPAEVAPSRILEDNVYPALVGVVAVVFRIGALVVSLAGLVAVAALSYASSLMGEVGRLRRQQSVLEARVAALEAAGGGS